MDVTTYIVAAFTDQKYAGSPTGVVLEAGDLNDTQRQRIANQTGCSHTAFITELAHEDADCDIRFFTPTGEIKNCGHGTIAAHVLRSLHGSADGIVRQRTASGLQDVEVRRQNDRVMVYLKQDEIRFSAVDLETVNELLAVFGLNASALDALFPVCLASPGSNRFLLALNRVEALHALEPDIPALKTLCQRVKSIGCFVFHMDSPVEATARMFSPVIGIDEDNVNGNSSGCLGAYCLYLDPTRAEVEMNVRQGHAFNRPGVVRVNARRVGSAIETVIGGTAVIESSLSLTAD